MTPTMTAAEQDGLALPQRRWSTLTVLLGIAMTVVDSTMMGMVLPDLTRDLQVSPASVIAVVNAYQVAILALLLPIAALAERIGARKVYLAGMAVFGIASALCCVAPNLAFLVAARVLQGVGGAGMFACNTALVRATYPRALLGRGIALNSVIVGAGSVAGPPLAALLLSIGSWHLLFAINIPVALGTLILGWHHLPRHEGTPGVRLSGIDITLNAAMFTTLFLGANALLPQEGVATSITHAMGLLAAGAGLGTLYLRRQRRETVPLLPLDLLRLPMFRLSVTTSVATFSAYTLASIALPFMLLGERHYSHAQTGTLLAMWPLATIAMAPLAGRLIGRVPDGLIAGIGLLAMGLGFSCVALLPTQTSMTDVAWRLALCGLGFGLFQSPNNHAILTSAPEQRAATVGGTMASARLIGETGGALLLAGLFSTPALSHAGASQWALWLSALLCGIAATVSLRRLRAAAPSAR